MLFSLYCWRDSPIFFRSTIVLISTPLLKRTVRLNMITGVSLKCSVSPESLTHFSLALPAVLQSVWLWLEEHWSLSLTKSPLKSRMMQNDIQSVLPKGHCLYAVALIIVIIFVVLIFASASGQPTGQTAFFCRDVRGAADSWLWGKTQWQQFPSMLRKFHSQMLHQRWLVVLPDSHRTKQRNQTTRIRKADRKINLCIVCIKTKQYLCLNMRGKHVNLEQSSVLNISIRRLCSLNATYDIRVSQVTSPNAPMLNTLNLTEW